ncbi:MAG: dihydropteroate synthase [Roseobacter sp.]
MTAYFRPLVHSGPTRPPHAIPLAGGWGWFTELEVLRRDEPPEFVTASDVPAGVLKRLTDPRPAVAGLCFTRPLIMGILNTTPDSFSDGGAHVTQDQALVAVRTMGQADIIDVGGESTRPGALPVDTQEEIRRTEPVISAIRRDGWNGAISIDTRKQEVARAAHAAGATLVNDVSGFTHDPALAPFCASRSLPVCVMHALGDPQTMQQNPTYDDVVLDVYDFLSSQIEALVATGVRRDQIIADPGIGFGKTLDHNLTLLANMSVFHGLGVPILLGASRKRFIGTISGVEEAAARMPGSIAVALAAVAQGVQILRVHDVPQTAQAIALWRAAVSGTVHD